MSPNSFTLKTMAMEDREQRKFGDSAKVKKMRRRWFVTLIGGRRRRVTSIDGMQTVAISLLGGSHIDMSAVVNEPIDLVVFSVIGGTDIWIPRGSLLDLSAFVVLGGSNDESENLEGSPAVRTRIRVFSLIGGVRVRTGSPTE